MAAPARPNITIDVANNVTVYQSLDNTDETIFNNLQVQYERAAFIDVIATWRGQFEPGFTGVQVALVNGHDIQALWSRKRQYRVSPRKKRAMRPKPATAAEAPVPAVVPALPAIVPPLPTIAQPLLSPPTIIPLPVLTLSAIQSIATPTQSSGPMQHTSAQTIPSIPEPDIQTDKDELYHSASSDGSSSSGGEFEPSFLMHNNPAAGEYLLPTKQRRRSISNGLTSDADSRRYRFVGVLQQSSFDAKNFKAIMPEKSNYLFIRQSATGIIEEQVAAKVVDLTADRSLQAWTDREIEAYELLKSTLCPHVIGYRGYRKSTQTLEGRTIAPDGRSDRLQTCYIYSDYAVMGDLSDVCKAHKTHGIRVPELFIWLVMQVLVDALCTLRSGNCSAPLPRPKNTPSAPWRPMLHLDIKGQNIFLQAPSEEYPGWPRPVLADFDTTVVLESEESKREDQLKIARQTGTFGWLPPERNFHAVDNRGGFLGPSEYSPHGWTLNEKSDIWGVGAMAYVLTRAHVQDKDLEENCRKAKCSRLYDEGQGACKYMDEQARHWWDSMRHRVVRDDESACPPLKDLSSEYSVGLYKQIQACMKLKPESRPTLEQLKEDIDAEIERLKYWYKSAMSQETDEMHALLKVHTKNDKWKDFRIGKRYGSPRKRRKVELTDGVMEEYEQAIASWKDEAQYPRPTLEQQAELAISVENFYIKSDVFYFMKNDAAGLSKRHFCTMMNKRAEPGSVLGADVVRDYDGTMQNAFKDTWKKGVLQELLNKAIPALMTEPDLGSPPLCAINAFRHALEWGLLLLSARGEGSPSLPNRTLLHKGVYDYIFPDSELLKRLKE